MSTKDLIDAIAAGDSLAVQSEFENAMVQRVAECLDAMRVDVAANMFKESDEQLDELTGKTLGSYIQKAHAADNAKRDHGRDLDVDPRVQKVKAKTKEYMDAKKWKQYHKSNDKEIEVKKKIDPDYPKSVIPTHRAGIEKASDRLRYGKKLTKEEFTLEDFSVEELEDFMVSEVFEQLDEISKKALGSYVSKAAKRLTKD